jgi:hypothetical protein
MPVTVFGEQRRCLCRSNLKGWLVCGFVYLETGIDSSIKGQR